MKKRYIIAMFCAFSGGLTIFGSNQSKLARLAREKKIADIKKKIEEVDRKLIKQEELIAELRRESNKRTDLKEFAAFIGFLDEAERVKDEYLAERGKLNYQLNEEQ